ncbi:hypothetical protein [Streptomyces sp. NPDC092129]|uniref:hypothetical protein n=1 Tax=Streptomyces sp. NPDC092129 TaxID=3366010 RepID=UPI00382CCAD5
MRIEVAALPLRRYLAVRERFLVVQYDRITYLDTAPAPSIKATDRTKVSTFDFHRGHEGSPGFVRLCGKHLILPIDAKPTDLAYPYTTDELYPEYTIGTDPSTGRPITFTCDPNRLSSAFKRRATRRHRP